MKRFRRLPTALHLAAYDFRRWRQRLALAMRFASGRLSPEDAARIRWQCQDIEGFYPLESIDAESTADAFADTYGDHPALLELARQATARVGRKWCSTGDVASTAQDWAFDLMREYAELDGTTLPTGEDEIAA